MGITGMNPWPIVITKLQMQTHDNQRESRYQSINQSINQSGFISDRNVHSK